MPKSLWLKSKVPVARRVPPGELGGDGDADAAGGAVEGEVPDDEKTGGAPMALAILRSRGYAGVASLCIGVLRFAT